MKGRGGIDFLTHLLDDEILRETIKKFLLSQPIEISYYAVVVDDLKMRGREGHRHEIIVFLITAMVGICGSLLCSYKSGGRRAMMTVGNVKIRYFSKFLRDEFDCLVVGNLPECMTETVGGDEIIFRFCGCHFPDDTFEDIIIGEGKEDRLYVGVVDADMLHAVFLFIAAGELMFLDAPLHIVVDPRSHNKTVLGATVHCLGIYIVFLFLIFHEPAVVLKFLKVLDCFLIYGWVVFVKTHLEIYLGLDDMIERFLITFGFLSGFLAVEDVIRS